MIGYPDHFFLYVLTLLAAVRVPLVKSTVQKTIGVDLISKRAILPEYLSFNPSAFQVQLFKSEKNALSTRQLRRDAGIEQVNTDVLDGSYYTLLSVGNITFRVALDTASSDLWLLSSACTSNECKSVPTYPLSFHSSTFTPINDNQTSFNLSFADGTASSGFIARESVQFQNLTIDDQIIGLVNNTDVTFGDEVSGILGLGFQRLSTFSSLSANATPFVNSLAQQGDLDYPLFALSLVENTGTITLGAIDGSVVQNVNNILWHDVAAFPLPSSSNNSSDYYLQWALQLSSIMVNNTVIDPQSTYPAITANRSLALLDIGTNAIFGPYQDVERIYDLIPSSRLISETGVWAVPCSIPFTLSFSFGTGEQYITLQPTDFLVGPAEGDPDFCISFPQALPPSADGLDWQFGIPFLQKVYSIFSFGINEKEAPMIGLYALNNGTGLLETSLNISSFFASESATIATTLPNFPLATPTPTPPPYLFNNSIPALFGQLAYTDLGTSAYSPILSGSSVNGSAIPTILPTPTVATLVITNSVGSALTTTTHIPQPSVILGLPSESSGTALLRPSGVLISISMFVFMAASFSSFLSY